MRSALNRLASSVFVALAACTSTVRAPGPSAPVPANPEQKEQELPPTSSWSFTYLAGVTAYHVERDAAIESQSDSGSVRQTTSNLTHELLTLERVGDTIQFVIAADTFATRPPNSAVGTLAPALPATIAGIRAGDSLLLNTDTLSSSCSPVQSVLVSDLHNLLASFPGQLTRGMSWSDSVKLTGCQGTIPTLARIKRQYRVSGDTAYEGSRVVVVERIDSIQAQGEGAQQQHRMLLNAIGSGTARYLLDPLIGRVARLSTTHNLSVTITVSGKSHRFTQDLKQELVLTR